MSESPNADSKSACQELASDGILSPHTNVTLACDCKNSAVKSSK